MLAAPAVVAGGCGDGPRGDAALSRERRRPRRHGVRRPHRDRDAVRALRQRRGEPFAARDRHRRGRRHRRPRPARRRSPPGRDVMTLTTIVVDFVDRDFARETEFLAELVKVPSDNPPGDCAAHADVVPPGLGWRLDPYGATVEDGAHGPVMYGRGVAVSKSDFATYTWALLALEAAAAQGANLAGTLELHFTYDEETGGALGPKWLIEEKLTRPDAVIAAGFSYAVVTAHNGCLHLEVTVTGRQAHAAMPESGADALEASTAVLAALYAHRSELGSLRSRTPGIVSPTLNVGLIKGGINTNVVPDQVVFRIDRRMIPEEDAAEVEADLRGLIAAAGKSRPQARVDVRQHLLALPLAPQPGVDRL